jgi:hypothetical protein
MLRKILLALVALVLIFVLVVALQPSDFRVERSAAIAAPQARLFGQVNDLRKWEAWSPWSKLDPDAKIGFEGPPSGEGATMSWAGNEKIGKGKMWIVESRPNELVKLKADWVEPFAGSSDSEFVFKGEGDRTEVTWTMSSRHGFLEKAICLVMNGKKIVGGDMEKGLAQMKALAETGGN